MKKEHRKALKELRNLEDEVILPADKGNATVVMKRSDYDERMRGMLDVQLRVKEALYIQKTPTNNRLNRDEGYELPGCWIATVKKLGGGVSSSRASANRVSAWTSAPDRMRAQAQEPRL